MKIETRKQRDADEQKKKNNNFKLIEAKNTAYRCCFVILFSYFVLKSVPSQCT